MAPAALQCSRAGAHRAPRLLPRRGGLLAPVARPPPGGRPPTRPYASSSPSSSSHPATGAAPTPGKTPPADADADAEPPAPAPAPDEDGGDEPPRGAMSRRLAAATEDALLTGGRAGRRAVADAGFSDELKARLLAKVQDARFRSEHAGAFAEAGLAGGASARARAAAPPGPAWTGEESTEAAVRRMLQDAHKPLRPGAGGGGGKPRLPDLQPIDLRLAPAPRASPGERAATAREKAGAYADERTTGTGTAATGGRSAEERAAFRREVQERFGPAGRTMPATLTGLASLANERIEDAMARGQFRGIARGAGVGRDARADNPFVDTTEYILNKMIQRQDLAPPWIEKQQELRRATRVFRARLRADWRRHAARMIAAGGGPLAHQLRRARRLARAEALLHPPAPGTTTTTTTPPPADDDAAAGGLAEAERRVLSEWATEEEQESDPRPAPTESRSRAPADATIAGSPAPSASSAKEEDVAKEEEEEKEEEEDEEDEAVALPRPFRDADWVAAERAYMEAAVRHLNALTRSYNLMAPELAKKPYFSLERELARCYADVAPTVAAAIRDRAAAPPARRPSLAGDRARPGLLDRFGGGERDGAAKVYDSRAPHYGFREMWRDLFGGGKTG